MKEFDIITKYLFPVMLQIVIVALLAWFLKSRGITIGYSSGIGMVLIAIAGISSALWGIVYQCRYNHKSLLNILKDFCNIKQSMTSYLLVVLFLLILFGGAMISKGIRINSFGLFGLLFLKAILFGGIEEIGWRYTFQPVVERATTYVLAVLITFVCWGIWHLLFFYIDGTLSAGANIPFFLLGLLTNCFILSALYAYSGSLWICVMTHALINTLSQVETTENGNIILSITLKALCIVLAIFLYYMASRRTV